MAYMDTFHKVSFGLFVAALVVGGGALLFNNEGFREAFFESELYRNPLR